MNISDDFAKGMMNLLDLEPRASVEKRKVENAAHTADLLQFSESRFDEGADFSLQMQPKDKPIARGEFGEPMVPSRSASPISPMGANPQISSRQCRQSSPPSVTRKPSLPLSPADNKPNQSPSRSRTNSVKNRPRTSSNRNQNGKNSPQGNIRRDGSQTQSGVEYSATGSNRVLRVAKDTNVKNLAGSIAWIARDGECPEILCNSALAINQAVKAMAIARTYLAGDNVDYYIYASFTNEAKNRRQKSRKDTSVKFDLRKTVRRVRTNAPPPIDDPEELRIGKETNAGKVAGAIATNIREGVRCQLTGVGADAVCNAVTAVGIARKYLAEDGVDIAFQALFNKLEADDGRTINCVCMKLLAEQF